MKLSNKNKLAGLLVVAAIAPMEVGAMENQPEQNEKSLSQQIHEEKMAEKVADEHARSNEDQYGSTNTHVYAEVDDLVKSQPVDVIEADGICKIITDETLGETEKRVALQMALETATYADVNSKNSDGNPIIFVAYKAGNFGLLRYLVEKGADVNAVGHYGAILDQPCKLDVKIARYLVQKGLDINAHDIIRRTMLHREARRSDLTVQFLFENGADPLIVDKFGTTARDQANQAGEKENEDYLVFAEDLQRLFDNTITLNTFIGRRFTITDKKAANKNLVETIKILLARGYYELIEKLFVWDKKKCSIVIQAIDPNITAEPGKDLWFLQLCRCAIAKENMQLFSKIVTDKPQIWKTIENVIYESPELNLNISKFKKMFGAGDGDFTKKPMVNFVKTMSLLKDAWEKADKDVVREPILNFMSKKNAVAKVTYTDNTFEKGKVVKTEKKTVPNDVVSNILGFLGNN